MKEVWTPEEFRKYRALGIEPSGKGKNELKKEVKAKEIEKKQDSFKEHLDTTTDLFATEPIQVSKSDKEFVELTIILSGEPMPKQSYRSGVTRHRSDGYHTCPYTGQSVFHKKGDVLTYKRKDNGMVDVIPIAYVDEKYTKRTAEYKLAIQQQLPSDFVMFTEEVHIVSLEYIFSPLKSFSKKILEGLQNKTLLKYKNVKPDWENTSKLLMDSMSDLVYKDDALIVTLKDMVKRYGWRAGVIIKMRGY